jgi:hypothetical protein
MKNKEYYKNNDEDDDNTTVNTGLIFAYLWFFSFGVFLKVVFSRTLDSIPNWVTFISILLLFVPPFGPLISSILFYYYST